MSPMYPDMMSLNTTLPSTTESHHEGDSTPQYVGYICAVTAVVLYGSNFVPVKKYHTGDGMFFQWILCSGIFFSGLVLQMIHNCTIYVLPMLGGVIWAVGNLCVVPIIKTIGMGLGLSIWGTCALCIGWAIGRFGLFETPEANIHHLVMNDLSIVLALISIFILLMVKNDVNPSDMVIVVDEKEPLLGKDTSINVQLAGGSSQDYSSSMSTSQSRSADDILIFKSEDATNRDGNVQSKELKEESEEMWVDKFSPMGKRLIGSGLSIFSGLMYGVNFTPTLYVQNNYKSEKGSSGLDFVFAQFCGIYLASTVFFIIYCIFKKNKPKVYPQVIVPGIISGIMWAIATGCWNIANSTLSQAISFPIVATGPCGLASLFWGTFIFREIKGAKNIGILVVGFLINLTGSLLAGFSK